MNFRREVQQNIVKVIENGRNPVVNPGLFLDFQQPGFPLGLFPNPPDGFGKRVLAIGGRVEPLGQNLVGLPVKLAGFPVNRGHGLAQDTLDMLGNLSCGRMFLGPIGELVGAFIALLVLVSLLSGLVVYAPHARRVAFGAFRRGRGPRLLQLDLHNFIGAIVLGWALVVTLTGFLLGFGTIATGLWAQGELARVQAAYGGEPVDPRSPPVDVDGAYRAALLAAPEGWHVSSIIWPGTDYSTRRHYTVLVGGSGLDERLVRVVLVDAETGAVTGTAQLPWYLKAITLSEPLHFGDYGGLPLKLLWTACTWLTLFITGNGAWLWWNRRKSRRRARPSKEAIT